MKPGLRVTLSGACIAAALALLPAAAQETPAPLEPALAAAVVSPAPPGGVNSALSAPDTMVISWTPATSLGISAYRVYYGNATGTYNGVEAREGASPVQIPLTSNSASLSGLSTIPPATPPAPGLVSLAPAAGAFQVTWNTVPGATGYRIYYSKTNFDDNARPDTFIDVGEWGTTPTALMTTLSGLEENVFYFVAVSALAQRTVYAAVTAVVNPALAPAPGSGNESVYSEETSQGVGTLQLSPLSNSMSATTTSAGPVIVLKEGCFIATAAYGSPLAPKVQLLRSFRDRYLVTNAPGRAFVAWYYRHGPAWAHSIEEHPWLKAPVRAALLPAILFAWLMLHPPVAAALVLASAALLPLKRRRSSRA
ncbi:CFI-box-CTERM domain-containing protein [Geomonas ferrireducens]|uniref:CFI-box-CTERM domain-containing protein n=1 Tax=Geomonas ferrireducens TaxID=2570227 RepID=UPI0010A7DA37|nr:fibronectin type III domain-containing protein [Geomonas ferrireducens]